MKQNYYLLRQARSYLASHSGQFDLFNSADYEAAVSAHLDLLLQPANQPPYSTFDQIAEASNPMMGYGRAALCYYFGECRYEDYGIPGSQPRSISSNNKSQRVYPNPTHDRISIQHDGECSYTIYDVSGRLVSHGILPTVDKEIDIVNLASGLYFLQISDLDGIGVFTEKFMKI